MENEKGILHAVMAMLADAQINVRAMAVAEAGDFGVVRLIVKDTDSAEAILKNNGFSAKSTDVIGVSIPDEFGALCKVINLLGENGINIEYSYSLMGCKHGNANILVCVRDIPKAESVLTNAGVRLFTNGELV
jgi:hypothetical protein